MAISDRDFDLKKGLIEKSIEAYVLALETINRLTIRYRLETFCYLVCNAWELLLKAKIIDRENDSDSIFYSCLLYTSPSPRDGLLSRMPSSA